MKTLKNPLIPAIVLFLVLLGTVKHNALVYLRISPENFPEPWNFIYAAFIVLSIDAAVMVFVIHGKKVAAGVFSFAIMLVNLLYFLPAEELVEKFPHDPVFSVKIAASLIFSGMYAYAIYQFSELFVKDIKEDEKERKRRKKSVNAGFEVNSPELPQNSLFPNQGITAVNGEFSLHGEKGNQGITPVNGGIPHAGKNGESGITREKTGIPLQEKRESEGNSHDNLGNPPEGKGEFPPVNVDSEAGIPLREISEEVRFLVKKWETETIESLKEKRKYRRSQLGKKPDHLKKDQYFQELQAISVILNKP